MQRQRADDGDSVGLCRTCRHVRVVPARAGSLYYRCERSVDDPRYPRYPVLPVLACRGHEPRGNGPAPLPQTTTR